MALKVTVVGIGLVGEAIVSCLKERRFPCEWPPRVAATRERPQTLAARKMVVEETTAEVFDGADVVLFAGKEGASGASVTWRQTRRRPARSASTTAGTFASHRACRWSCRK